MDSNPAAERGEGAGHCGVSAEQGGAVMRIVSGPAADAAVKRLESRETRLTGLESRVRRIVENVRRGGERSLRGFAEKWDGLGAKQSLQVPEQEMKDALHQVSGELRNSLRLAARNIRQFCEWQKPKSWMRSRGGISVGKLCGLSMPWVAMCRAGAIRWFRRC